jgi:hypothetical protein
MNCKVSTITLLLVSSLLAILPLAFAAKEGLVLYMPFDGNTEDASGNGNHGEVKKGKAKWTDGKFGRAMEFDGATHIEIPDKKNSGFDNVSGFTVEVWVKQSTHHNNGIVVKLTTAGQFWPCSYNLETWADQLAYFGVGADTGQWATSKYPLNEWFHFTGVFDAGKEHVYVDGKPGGTVSDPSKTVPDGDLPVYVGCVDPNSYPFIGALDELAIYSRALSEAEIQEDMNNGIVMPVGSRGKLTVTWATIKVKE